MAVTADQQGIVAKFKEHDARIDTLTRRGLFPLAVTNNAGVRQIEVDLNGDMTLRSADGTIILATDPVGYGLATPGQPVPMYLASPGVFFWNAGGSNNVPTALYEGFLVPTNPGLEVQFQLVTQSTGGTVTGQAWVELVSQDGTYVHNTSTISSTATGGLQSPVSSAILGAVLPEHVMGQRIQVLVKAQMTSGAGSSNSVAASPWLVLGTSAAVASALPS